MIIRGEVILGLYIVGMIIACIVGALIFYKKKRKNYYFIVQCICKKITKNILGGMYE